MKMKNYEKAEKVIRTALEQQKGNGAHCIFSLMYSLMHVKRRLCSLQHIIIYQLNNSIIIYQWSKFMLSLRLIIRERILATALSGGDPLLLFTGE
jgi:hypothetical protein